MCMQMQADRGQEGTHGSHGQHAQHPNRYRIDSIGNGGVLSSCRLRVPQCRDASCQCFACLDFFLSDRLGYQLRRTRARYRGLSG